MNRKLTCILACVLIIATVIPSMALAVSNATILDKLKLSDVKKYDVALPTKGTNKTKKQIVDLLKKIPNKPSGKGNTCYTYNLYFNRLSSKKPGNYEYANVRKSWCKYVDKTRKFSSYYEDRDLKDTKAGIFCCIEKTDTKDTNVYYWIKGKKTGNHRIYKNEVNSNASNNSSNNTNIKTTEDLNYKLYPDATMLGEKCMVYSYEYKYSDGMSTRYNFVTRNTGQYIKYISVESETIYTSIDFERKFFDKADSFFDPPKDVKFTTYKD